MTWTIAVIVGGVLLGAGVIAVVVSPAGQKDIHGDHARYWSAILITCLRLRARRKARGLYPGHRRQILEKP